MNNRPNETCGNPYLKHLLGECSYGTIFKDAPIGIEIFDSGGLLLDINDACLKIFGINCLSDVKHLSLFDSPSLSVAAVEKLRSGEVIHVENSFDFEYITKHKIWPTTRSGVIYLEVTIRPICKIMANNVVGYVAHLQDITERKNAEHLLQRSVREKEVLLKEIQHRVKNNLQVVYSLLNLQANQIEDEKVRGPFQESRNRIKAMALIQEKLYQSGDLAFIDFKQYLQHLVSSISQSFKLPRISIAVDVDLENVMLDVITCVPCALIVNELVTNAMNHAFPDNMTGMIRVGLTKNSDGIHVLSVSDNGIGFPEHIDFRKATSLGLQLVNVLTKQINGTLELSVDEGANFHLTFSVHN